MFLVVIMNKKAFFSTVILIFVFLILLFFLSIRDETKPLSFSDAPRYFALKVEEAYAIADKNISYAYVDYKMNYSRDCNTLILDANKFFNTYLTLTKVNDICVYAGINQTNTYNPANKSFDANYKIKIKCFLDLNKDIEEQYQYNKTFVFHKRYQSFETSYKECHFILADLDANKVYVDLIK